MAKLTREEREEIARRRLLRIVEAHGAANPRTLEQKISDAGPNPQRIDPHILTPVRNLLVEEGKLLRSPGHNVTWYYAAGTSAARIKKRIAEQNPVFGSLLQANHHIGQALEIATYRALLRSPHPYFFGRYTDLEKHDDSTLYSKEEPPQHLGPRSLPGKQRLDFIIQDALVGPIGIECKNIREWVYPDRKEIIELTAKCLALNCIPVLIARRIPYVTFRLLNSCGFVMHQTYNQLLPGTMAELAERAKHKDNLGFHDIRTGNAPDARLQKFISKDLLPAAATARARFDANRDLLEGFVGDMTYVEFSARVRRREGAKEDNDWPDEPEPEDNPYNY